MSGWNELEEMIQRSVKRSHERAPVIDEDCKECHFATCDMYECPECLSDFTLAHCAKHKAAAIKLIQSRHVCSKSSLGENFKFLKERNWPAPFIGFGGCTTSELQAGLQIVARTIKWCELERDGMESFLDDIRAIINLQPERVLSGIRGILSNSLMWTHVPHFSLLNAIAGCLKSENMKMLDLGCGRGFWTSMFHVLGVNVTGLDGNPAADSFCNLVGCPFIEKDFENISTEDAADIDVLFVSWGYGASHTFKTLAEPVFARGGICIIIGEDSTGCTCLFLFTCVTITYSSR